MVDADTCRDANDDYERIADSACCGKLPGNGMDTIDYSEAYIRLLDARRLIVTDATNVETAAYEVGYESPSQFSREYSRMFGAPPRRDVSALRAMASQGRRLFMELRSSNYLASFLDQESCEQSRNRPATEGSAVVSSHYQTPVELRAIRDVQRPPIERLPGRDLSRPR
jgi:hypothetical protein